MQIKIAALAIIFIGGSTVSFAAEISPQKFVDTTTAMKLECSEYKVDGTKIEAIGDDVFDFWLDGGTSGGEMFSVVGIINALGCLGFAERFNKRFGEDVFVPK